jgi:uncharacterized membrane protein YkvA (DUF1232 family)
MEVLMRQEEIDKEYNRLISIDYTEADFKDVLNKKEYVYKLISNGCKQIKEKISHIDKLYTILENNKFNFNNKIVKVALGVLVYVISPIDIVPDVIPVLGLVDDACMIAKAFSECPELLNL